MVFVVSYANTLCELARIVKHLFSFDRTPNHCMEQNPAKRQAVRILAVVSMRSGVRAGSLMQTGSPDAPSAVRASLPRLLRPSLA